MESLEILLEKSARRYSLDEKREMAERKNTYYRELLRGLSPVTSCPVIDIIKALKDRSVKIAIGSRARTLVRSCGLWVWRFIDMITDGNHITG